MHRDNKAFVDKLMQLFLPSCNCKNLQKISIPIQKCFGCCHISVNLRVGHTGPGCASTALEAYPGMHGQYVRLKKDMQFTTHCGGTLETLDRCGLEGLLQRVHLSLGNASNCLLSRTLGRQWLLSIWLGLPISMSSTAGRA